MRDNCTATDRRTDEQTKLIVAAAVAYISLYRQLASRSRAHFVADSAKLREHAYAKIHVCCSTNRIQVSFDVGYVIVFHVRKKIVLKYVRI